MLRFDFKVQAVTAVYHFLVDVIQFLLVTFQRKEKKVKELTKPGSYNMCPHGSHEICKCHKAEADEQDSFARSERFPIPLCPDI